MTQGKRARFYDEAAALTTYVSAEAGGAVFLVRTQDQNVSRSLFLKQGRREMEVLERAVALIAGTQGNKAIKRRQFVDVGANIGTTTVPALLTHRFGSAVAFEPEPENLLTLRLNLTLNGLEGRASAEGLAVSDRNGTSELVVNLEQGGKHWIATDRDKLDRRGDDTTVVEVETVTLDEMASRGVVRPKQAGLLWVDAQAHEGHILEGAGTLTGRGVPLVLELDPGGLDKLGDRDALQDVVEEHYTHFVDLRPSVDSDQPAFESRPASALGEHAAGLIAAGGRSLTDILVLRLGPEHADGVDVAGVLERHRPKKPRKAKIHKQRRAKQRRSRPD